MRKLLQIGFMLLTLGGGSSGALAGDFKWPDGKRAAVCLTFDDSRPSQLDFTIPVLDEFGLKGTFYIVPDVVKLRLQEWQAVAAHGHEIGNHTMRHACSCNYPFSRRVALEDYSPEEMAHELDVCTEAIQSMFGVRPRAFAYPCGQTFVGRGTNIQSYAPLVAGRFLTGRSSRSKTSNDPMLCDFAQLMAATTDDMTWPELKEFIDDAMAKGNWIILGAHEGGSVIGDQTISQEVLKSLCAYLKDPKQGAWVGTVSEVAAYVAKTRNPGQEHPISSYDPRRSSLKRWLNVLSILGVGILAGIGGYFLQTLLPRRTAHVTLFLGAMILFAAAAWLSRFGYVGLRGLFMISALLCYCLGSWGSIEWHHRLLRVLSGHKEESAGETPAAASRPVDKS